MDPCAESPLLTCLYGSKNAPFLAISLSDFLGDFGLLIEVCFFKILTKKCDFLGDFGSQIEVRFFTILRKKN